MGFLDKAKKMAEQAQAKIDEVQTQFNQSQGSGPTGLTGVPATDQLTIARQGDTFVVAGVFDMSGGVTGVTSPDREARVDEFFLRAAALAPRRRFLLGGSGWEGKPLPPNVRSLGHVGTTDHNALNATPLAVLNVSRESMARNGYSPATRVFEAAGAGACLITDAWDGIELFLEPDVEVLVARDGVEVARHVAALDPQRARALGDAARARVLAEHTYAHRAELVESVLGVRA